MRMVIMACSLDGLCTLMSAHWVVCAHSIIRDDGGYKSYLCSLGGLCTLDGLCILISKIIVVASLE